MGILNLRVAPLILLFKIPLLHSSPFPPPLCTPQVSGETPWVTGRAIETAQTIPVGLICVQA